MWSCPHHLLTQSLTFLQYLFGPMDLLLCLDHVRFHFCPQGLCTAAWDTLSLDSHGSLPHSLEVFAQMLPSQWDLPGFLHLNCSAHLTPGLLSHLSWLYPFCSIETLLKYCKIYVFIMLFYLLFVSPLEYERTEIFFPSFVHWCAYGRCSRFQGSLKEHLPVHFWVSVNFMFCILDLCES